MVSLSEDTQTVIIFSAGAADNYKNSSSDKYDEFIQSIRERIQESKHIDLFDTRITKRMGEFTGGDFTGIGVFITATNLTILEITLIWDSDSDSRPENWPKITKSTTNIVDSVFGSDPEITTVSSWDEYVEYSRNNPDRVVFDI